MDNISRLHIATKISDIAGPAKVYREGDVHPSSRSHAQTSDQPLSRIECCKRQHHFKSTWALCIDRGSGRCSTGSLCLAEPLPTNVFCALKMRLCTTDWDAVHHGVCDCVRTYPGASVTDHLCMLVLPKPRNPNPRTSHSTTQRSGATDDVGAEAGRRNGRPSARNHDGSQRANTKRICRFDSKVSSPKFTSALKVITLGRTAVSTHSPLEVSNAVL